MGKASRRKRDPRPIRSVKRKMVDLHDVVRTPPGPVTLDQREGVFAHSFKCLVCKLEFITLSWLPNRQRVGVTFCPECGQTTDMLHFRATLSESETLSLEGPNEIYRLWKWPSSQGMDDSAVYGLDPLRGGPKADS